MNPIDQAAQQNQQAPDPEQSLEATNSALIKKQQDDKAKNQSDENMAAISQAAALLHPNGTDPQTQIGKSIATPGYAYSGLCLKWVDDQQGTKNRQPTAFADYQSKAQNGSINQSTDNIPAGARVYFAPDNSNGGAGHVGISKGNGNFTSATDNGIKTFSLQNWMKYTGQKFIGWSK